MNKQEILTKYGRKFASGGLARPILAGVHYAAEGTAYATNGQYGLRIRNAHALKETMTLEAKTGQPLEGVYPASIDKVFSVAKASLLVVLPGTALKDIVARARIVADAASRLNKKEPVCQMETENGTAWLRVTDEDVLIHLKVFLGNVDSLANSKRSLNAEYLYTALALFCDHSNHDVTLRLGDALHPILLSDGHDVDVVILPYRIQR